MRKVVLDNNVVRLHDGGLYVPSGKSVYIESWPPAIKEKFSMLDWLKGKKTILVQLGALLTAGGAYLSGTLELGEFLKIMWAALTLIYGAIKVNRIANGG